MPVPWLRILDAVIGVTDLARSRKIRSLAASGEPTTEIGSPMLGNLETRLAGVVVAALKEAFDRDTRRLDLEREQLEAERQRAERALQLELVRQAADREIGRLRTLAGIAIAAWLGSLFGAVRASNVGARVSIGVGWVLLLGAIASSFSAQSRVSEAAARERSPSTDGGAMTLWLTLAGLALVAAAVLL